MLKSNPVETPAHDDIPDLQMDLESALNLERGIYRQEESGNKLFVILLGALAFPVVFYVLMMLVTR